MSPAPGGEALVLRVAGPTATLLLDGAEREVRMPPRLPGGPPVAGDRVGLRGSDADLTIALIAPRRTVLARGDGPERRPRPLAANADLLVVVAAAGKPPLRPRLVDRYLVAAEDGGLDACLAITKTDLPHDAAMIDEVSRRYADIGYPVLRGSAIDGGLAAELRSLIGLRVAVLAGHSGVGKSTLTSALTGVERAVGALSLKAGTGRHTTTDPRLILMAGGGAVVDTAGVRTFHLPRLDRARLEQGFPEILRAASECRFRGCAHDGDAGCAVTAAVTPERLDSYRRMLHDLP